jgi:alpha-L-fucosidase 2
MGSKGLSCSNDEPFAVQSFNLILGDSEPDVHSHSPFPKKPKIVYSGKLLYRVYPVSGDRLLNKWFWIIVPLMIIGVLVGWRLKLRSEANSELAQQQGARQGMAPPVEIATAERKAILSYIESVGTVESPYRVEISSKISGRIDYLVVREGDEVSKGQLLIKIDPSELQAQVLQLGTLYTSTEKVHIMEDYNVIWDSPSKDFNGSMPLGNGDIGINAWVEAGGDLQFYISKTDAWDDYGRLVKIGKVRVRLEPNPFVEGRSFKQTLQTHNATLQIEAGEGQRKVEVRVWVDANHPVIQVEVKSEAPCEAATSIELWRTKSYEVQPDVSDILQGTNTPMIVEPDTVLANQSNRTGWYHHNVKSVGHEMMAKLQGLTGFGQKDPILHRTFGAVITAAQGERLDDLQLHSPQAKQHRFNLYVLTCQPALPDEWLAEMDKVIRQVERSPLKTRRAAHERWWKDFWNRSRIHAVSKDGDAQAISRAYHLQRYINACNGRGSYPIKFNGAIFTVPAGPLHDPDYRRWGPGYWWQNTRLPYFSMPTSGDLDLMQPFFKMYAGEVLKLSKYRTKLYCGHEGAFLPECIYFWGAIFSETYGWTPFEQRTDKLQASRWHKWEWVGGLELAWMMLDYYEHTQDNIFLRRTLLPFAHEILTFFNLHYPTDEKGKIIMHPSQALETWWECTNPMPEVAGCIAVSERLLSIPEKLTTGKQRAFWRQLLAKMPLLPLREVEGKKALAPAEKFAAKSNVENPELYAVFPFRLIAIDKPNIEWGIEALKHRWDKGNAGWRQDDLFMAYLGLTGQVREYLVGRAKNYDQNSRFPAFWGPNYDWTPDQCHGGVLMKAFQSMILQTDGKKIYLLPALPEDWDVEFKLHAPYKTIVEGIYKNGKLEKLSVTPKERAKDVVLPGSTR